MATPHVAVVAALYLATHTSATPATGAARPNKVTNAGRGSVNLLLYSVILLETWLLKSAKTPLENQRGLFVGASDKTYKVQN